MILRRVCCFISVWLFVFLHSYGQLKKTEPIKGLQLKLPSFMTIMSDDDIARKYPTYKKPLAMYTSTDTRCDFGINISANNWGKTDDLEILGDFYRSTILSVFSKVDFIKDKLITSVHGRDFIWFEFTSEVIDDKKPDKTIPIRMYNFLAYTVFEDKILVFNYTCPIQDKNAWQIYSKDIFSSIYIKKNMKLEAFKPIPARRKNAVPLGEDGALYKKMREGK